MLKKIRGPQVLLFCRDKIDKRTGERLRDSIAGSTAAFVFKGRFEPAYFSCLNK